MAKKEKVPAAPRRRTPRSHGKRVPRPVEQWLVSLFEGGWEGQAGPDWVEEARDIASSYECFLIYDPEHRWQESAYFPRDSEFGRATILLGGAKATRLIGLSAFSHELSHHILITRGQNPSDSIEIEKTAWEIASELAEKHKLPICSKTRRSALYSYRYANLLSEHRGSKRQTRQPKPPKAVRLRESKRGSDAPHAEGVWPLGKKGKRLAKKDVKKTTRRAERHRGLEPD